MTRRDDHAVAEAIRIAKTYPAGSSAYAHLRAYWSDVNAALAAMDKPEAVLGDVLPRYEDECSADQAAYEIADPVFGYEAFIDARLEAWQNAHSEGR